VIFWQLTKPERELVIRKALQLVVDPASSWADKFKALVLGAPNAGLTVGGENTKLGPGVQGFSLPPGNVLRTGTCPGANELCEEICYASRGRMQINEWRYWVNWAFVELWPERFVQALTENPLSRLFRIHVGGDFYSASYIGLWERIIRENPRTRFWAYTRSHQDGRGGRSELLAPLRRLAMLPNMRLLLSADRLTGVPPLDLVPGAVRAWLCESDQDVPPEPVEVVFRNAPEAALSVLGGSPVCPVERASDPAKVAGKITCRNCAWCFDAAHSSVHVREGTLSRFSGFGGWDMPARVRGMFHGFAAERPRLGGPSGPGEDADLLLSSSCACGLLALCGFCGYCVECRCECP
jgi:hypothetical protein